MALYDPSTCSYRSFCGVAHKSEGLSLRGGRAGGSPHKFTILKQQLIVNYFSRIHPHAGRNSRVKALKAELSSLRYSWFLAFVTLMIHDSFTFFCVHCFIRNAYKIHSAKMNSLKSHLRTKMRWIISEMVLYLLSTAVAVKRIYNISSHFIKTRRLSVNTDANIVSFSAHR